MQTSYSPSIKPADFTTTIDIKNFPLQPGTTLVYRGKTKDTTERDVVTVTRTTNQIMGVRSVVVEARPIAKSTNKAWQKTWPRCSISTAL